MIKKNAFLFALVLVIFLGGCKSPKADEAVDGELIADTISEQPTLAEIIDDEATPAHYTTAGDGTQLVLNERFGFTFKLPANYTATDKSNNGDGYFIETGDKGVDLRIYGENIDGNTLMAELELSTCESTESFRFANGFPGTLCLQSGDRYYYYDTPKTRIICYVHAPKIWMQRNESKITEMAKSIVVNSKGF